MRLVQKILIALSAMVIGAIVCYVGIWAMSSSIPLGSFGGIPALLIGFLIFVFGLAYLIHKPMSEYEQRLPGDPGSAAPMGANIQDVQMKARQDAIAPRSGVVATWVPPVVDSLHIRPLEKEK